MVKNSYHKHQQGLGQFTVTKATAKTEANDGEKKMTEQETLVNWDDVMKEGGSDFLNFEELRERKTLVLNDIHVVKVVKKKYQSEEEAEMDELRATVLRVGNDTTVRKIGTNSRRFMQGLGAYLQELGTPEEVRKLTISVKVKKLGKDQGTNYDFEDFEVLEPIGED